MRRMSKEPERSPLRPVALHLVREDAAYTASPSLTFDAGSRSFTSCFVHPHSRSEMPNRWCGQLRSSMPASSRCRDSTLHTSRKCPVNQQPKPVELWIIRHGSVTTKSIPNPGNVQPTLTHTRTPSLDWTYFRTG